MLTIATRIHHANGETRQTRKYGISFPAVGKLIFLEVLAE